MFNCIFYKFACKPKYVDGWTANKINWNIALLYYVQIYAPFYERRSQIFGCYIVVTVSYNNLT